MEDSTRNKACRTTLCFLGLLHYAIVLYIEQIHHRDFQMRNPLDLLAGRVYIDDDLVTLHLSTYLMGKTTDI
jgi:hypothetical protein